MLVTAIVCIIIYFMCFLPSIDVYWLIVKFIICCIVTNVLFGIIYFRTIEFRQVKGLSLKLLKREK